MRRTTVSILGLAAAATLALTGCAGGADAVSKVTGPSQEDVLAGAAEDCNPEWLGYDDASYSVSMTAEEVEAPEQDASVMEDLGCVIGTLEVPSSVLNKLESSASIAGMGEAHSESWTDGDGHTWTLDWTMDIASGISADLSIGGE